MLRVLVVTTFRSTPVVPFSTEVLPGDLGPFENCGRPFALLAFALAKVVFHVPPRGTRSYTRTS